MKRGPSMRKNEKKKESAVINYKNNVMYVCDTIVEYINVYVLR